MNIKRISMIVIIAVAVMNGSAQSLHFINNATWVNIGDLDIQGDQITVEALIYMNSNSTNNVVSKHINHLSVNYLLRPLSFELTTYVNGNSGPTQFLQMLNPFSLKRNNWYHIAGTYDGSTVKYYVDGCLVIERPFTGNLYQNDFPAAIGNQSSCQCEQFYGYMDEVRIWNVSRTQDEIRDHMLDLPDPNIQTGLVAYYKLDSSLVNEQGNGVWNGTLVGNVQYTNDQADIQPFAITNIQVTNADCVAKSNGRLSISTNRPNTQYSLNGITFQMSNNFNNLASGNHQLFVKSPEGCIIDSMLTIGSNDFYFQINDVQTICQGEDYFGYSATGTYTDTLSAAVGCDSIRTINLTVLPVATLSETSSICQGEMYEGYAAGGTYVDVFTAANGCDSTRTLMLTVLPHATSSITSSICQGEVYEGYASGGTYVDVFTAANGCDSTRTLTLSVLPHTTYSTIASICQGEIYEGYIVSGTYVDVFTAANGCDSTRTLTLTVLPKATSYMTISICQGEMFEGYATSGTYMDVFTAANGCDSTRTLTLTVLPHATSSKTVSICRGEMYEGYSSGGTFVDVFTAANGCDSTRTLTLIIWPDASSNTISICQGEIYEGYSSGGTYVDVFTSSYGCDSTRTLTLIVNSHSEFRHSVTICPDSNYDFNGQIISVEGTYLATISNVLGCDSIITLNLVIAPSDFLGNDTTICIANEYQLVSPSGSTLWFDNDITKTKIINETGLYWAEILDANGCIIVDTIAVQFNVKTYIPNIFSPNDDGLNDCFLPFFSEIDISSYRFSVFDRWGSQIFSTNNPDDCWNGEYRGIQCNPDVYVYVVEIKPLFCEKTVIMGDITLIK